MDMPRNALIRALAEGRQQIGVWNTIRDSAVAEMLAGCGFDWILVDCEHTPNGVADVQTMLQVLHAFDISTMVRPTCLDPAEIKRILDIGALNILVPYVETVEQAELAVASVTYPPDGIRGVSGASRSSRYGAVANYIQTARAEIGLFLQVETRATLDRIEDIAAVPGVTGMFVGPADFAASLGHPGNINHPEVIDAVLDAIRRIRAAGLPAGFLSPDQSLLDKTVEAGSLFTAVDLDMLLLRRAALGRLDACKHWKAG
jgi:4-hydroxy-2-oxoheptanedioate aldolase